VKITGEVLNVIAASVTDLTFETGGILGSRDGSAVDQVVMDRAFPSNTKHCAYAPNVGFLNGNIARWQERGIAFQGIFHTHFAGVTTLSPGDKEYIMTIMNAMPPGMDSLYFPIYVLPQGEVIGYRAVRGDGTVEIRPEDVTICANENLK